jgi:hypothetical protein
MGRREQETLGFAARQGFGVYGQRRAVFPGVLQQDRVSGFMGRGEQ